MTAKTLARTNTPQEQSSDGRASRFGPAATSRKAPGFRQRFALPYGHFRRLVGGDQLATLLELRAEYGDVCRWDFGGYTIHYLFHPDHAQHVLQDDYKNYARSLLYNYLKLVVGEGLLTSEGEAWRRDRRMIQPAFHHQRLAAFGKLIVARAEAMCRRWESLADSGSAVDISQEMMRLTLAIISQALFNRDISGEADQLGQSTTTALEYLTYRINHRLAAPLWVPTRVNRNFKRAVCILDEHVSRIIAERRADSNPPDDLLTIMLAARDEETGAAMDDHLLRDQIVTFMGAGHETTAVALSWIFGLLSRHPDVCNRLRDEIDGALGGRPPGMSDLPKLPYTAMVLQEAMRLYPPVASLSRRTLEADEVSGYEIPANSLVILSQYVTHRHPDFWENAEGFDPERFAPGQPPRPKFAYFPFSGGPRKCIGDQFAMLEATLIVARVMQQFRLDLIAGHRLVPKLVFTVRPTGGMPMTIHRR
jgi:cytochrome P450